MIMRLTVLLLLCSITCLAQPKTLADITNSCSEARLKQNLYYLTDIKLMGRLMGSHGDTLASRYIASSFKTNQLQAPYENGRSYFQAITAFKQLDQKTFMINETRYEPFDGWSLYPNTPVNLKNIPVLFTDYDSLTDFYHDLPGMDVDGKAVCFNGKAISQALQSNIDSLETILKNKGARLVIWKTDLDKMLTGQKALSFLPHYQQPLKAFNQSAVLPRIGLSPARFNNLLAGDQFTANADGHFNIGKNHYLSLKATVTMQLTRELKEEHAPNVIGVIKRIGYIACLYCDLCPSRPRGY
jgi:hypothetical protein